MRKLESVLMEVEVVDCKANQYKKVETDAGFLVTVFRDKKENLNGKERIITEKLVIKSNLELKLGLQTLVLNLSVFKEEITMKIVGVRAK